MGPPEIGSRIWTLAFMPWPPGLGREGCRTPPCSRRRRSYKKGGGAIGCEKAYGGRTTMVLHTPGKFETVDCRSPPQRRPLPLGGAVFSGATVVRWGRGMVSCWSVHFQARVPNDVWKLHLFHLFKVLHPIPMPRDIFPSFPSPSRLDIAPMPRFVQNMS